MFSNLDKKQKIIFISCISGMFLIILFYFIKTFNSFSYSDSTNENFLSYENDVFIKNDSIEESSAEKSSIVIYITGEVNSPGVFSLPSNSRIKDAIESADGLTDSADLSNINLAFILSDGQKIYIPNKNDPSEVDTISSDDGLAIVSDNYTEDSASPPIEKVNINNATQTQLETLPGIGPSTALKIIDYRNKNTKFNKIEDIKNVSGIGETKFNKIKDFICIK